MDGIAFSSEHPDTADLSAVGVSCGEELVGRARPDQYSADLSLFALDAGLRLRETLKPRLMYLSTSDYVQHTDAPGAAGAHAFHTPLDRRNARMHGAAATAQL